MVFNVRRFMLGFVIVTSTVGCIGAFYMQRSDAGSAQAPDGNFVPGELLVKFAEGTTLSQVEKISDQVGATLEEKMAVGEPELYRVKVLSDLDVAIGRLVQNSEVIFAKKIVTPLERKIDSITDPNTLSVKFKPNTPQSKIDEANDQNRGKIVWRLTGDPDVYIVAFPPDVNLEDAIRRYRQHPNVSWVSKNSRAVPF